MKNKCEKAQNLLEYTLLIITVVAALMAMHVYIRRAVNARLHAIQIEMNPAIMIMSTGSQ